MFNLIIYRNVAACGSYEENEDITTEDPSVINIQETVQVYNSFYLHVLLIYSTGFTGHFYIIKYTYDNYSM